MSDPKQDEPRMVSEREAVKHTLHQHDVWDTCDATGCSRQVDAAATVDVVVGEADRTYDPSVVYVTSTDGGSATVEQWCLNCAQAYFDVNKPAGERSLEATNTILTPSNVVAFVFGLVTALFVLSFVVV